MKHCIIAILAILFLFACDDWMGQNKRGNLTLQKPARCRTLLRYSIEFSRGEMNDVAECINGDGHKAVFFKPFENDEWLERVMLEK